VFTRKICGNKFDPVTFDLWPWKSIAFQIFLNTKFVPSLVKIHWKMLILECSQGCYRVKIRLWPWPLTLWPWKSIGFQTLLRTKYVPRLVKIHWRMLILECSQGCYGRMDGSVTISHRNFVGEGIIKYQVPNFMSCKKEMCKFCWLQMSSTWGLEMCITFVPHWKSLFCSGETPEINVIKTNKIAGVQPHVL
jgi:hypothetical protein